MLFKVSFRIHKYSNRKCNIDFLQQCIDRNDNITRPTQVDEINWFNGIFIRAPGIVSIEDREQVKVLATLPNDSGNTQKPSFPNGT